MERTITYYPEAVVLKGSVKYEEDDKYKRNGLFVRD